MVFSVLKHSFLMQIARNHGKAVIYNEIFNSELHNVLTSIFSKVVFGNVCKKFQVIIVDSF